jgi:hypothetical protein
MPVPPEGGACSVDSAHQKASRAPVRPEKQPDAAVGPEGSTAAGQVRSEARRLPRLPFRPVLAARRLQGPVSWLPLVRRSGQWASTVGAPKSPGRRLSAGLCPEGPGSTAPSRPPRGESVAIGRCVLAACLPKGAGCRGAPPLSVDSRGNRLSVARALHPRVRSAGVSLRLLRGAASPPGVHSPEGGLVLGGWGRCFPLRRVGRCFPCDRSGLPKKIRRSGQTRHRFKRWRRVCPSRRMGGSSPKAFPIRSVCGESPSVCRLVVNSVPLSPHPKVEGLRFRSDRQWTFKVSRPCKYPSRSLGFAPSRS